MVHCFPYTRSMLPADYTLAFYFTAFFTLRVYGLFNCNRVILGLLSLGGLGFLAIGAVCAPTEDKRKRDAARIYGDVAPVSWDIVKERLIEPRMPRNSIALLWLSRKQGVISVIEA